MMLSLCLKRKITVVGLTLLVLIGFNSSAQITNPSMGNTGFRWVQPNVQGLTFTDISFIDNNSGLAISVSLQGTGGGIMKTTDGGRNWQFTTYRYVNNTNTVQLASFNDVHYVTPTIAYAVASSGIMIKSTDGGATWSQVVTPLTALSKTINGLHFINKDTGYIAGAAINTTNTTNINDAPKIYITRNGGISWDSLVTPFVRQETNASLNWNNNKEVYRLHFVNDSVGYASGTSGLLWKIEKNVITDYSLHRSKFGLATGSHTPSTSGYRGLLGINDSVVLMGSQNNSTVVRVKTGKNDSTASAAPAIYGDYVRGTYSVVVWLAGTSTPYPAPMAGNIGSSTVWHFRKGPDEKIWMIVGPNVCWSVDNGTNWGYSRLHPPSAAYQNNWPAQGLEVTPNGRIIVGFYNGLLYDSLPGSQAWQTAYSNLKPGTELGPYHYTNIDWADYCNGVVVGNAGTILKTSDGGKTWINNSDPTWDQTNVTPGIGIPIVKYPAPDKMFYLGGTTLYRSPDQGITRTGLFAEPSGNAAVNNFELVGDKAFVIAYRFSGIQRAFIYRVNNVNTGPTTVDIYNNFVTGATGSLAPQLRNIKFANADTGYTCGSRGKVYRTIDGGNTWTDISPDTLVNNNGSANYTALSVVNGSTIYIGGNTRKFFRSTDAGLTWTDMTFPVIGQTPFTNNTSILQILMNDPNNGYAVSSGNLLLKTTDGWNTWTYDLSPVTFQNIALYPKDNSVPFNSKKLYQIGFQNGTQPNSSNTAHLLEYGNFTLTDLKTTETTVGSSCTNPTAGSIMVTATGGILPYSYSINGGAFQSSNVFIGLTQGAKTITIKDAGCGVITKTITVPFTDNLTLTTNNDTTVCAGAPVQMLATSQATTYLWTPGSGLSNPNISNPIATVNANAAFTVTATLNGCVKIKTVNIIIKPNPVVNAGSDKTIVEGDETQLQGNANNSVSVAWTPANTLKDANTFSPIAKPTVTTTYTITVKNSDNCTSTDDVKIIVLPYCVKVMNAFTPNGDGANDRWIVTNGTGCTNRIKAAVFNRYGQQVYVNENYQNNWDGTFNGKPIPDGTYYYAISYFLINGKTVIVKGDLTILR